MKGHQTIPVCMVESGRLHPPRIPPTTSDGTRRSRTVWQSRYDSPPTRLLEDVLEWVEAGRRDGRRIRYLSPCGSGVCFMDP